MSLSNKQVGAKREKSLHLELGVQNFRNRIVISHGNPMEVCKICPSLLRFIVALFSGSISSELGSPGSMRLQNVEPLWEEHFSNISFINKSASWLRTTGKYSRNPETDFSRKVTVFTRWVCDIFLTESTLERAAPTAHLECSGSILDLRHTTKDLVHHGTNEVWATDRN